MSLIKSLTALISPAIISTTSALILLNDPILEVNVPSTTYKNSPLELKEDFLI